MNQTIRIFTTLLFILALLAGTSAMTFAQSMGMGMNGSTQGMGNQSQSKGMVNHGAVHKGDRFSVHGTVTSTDTTVTPNTLTVTIESASRLLKDYVGTDFLFHVSKTARVGAHGAGYNGFKLTLGDVKPGDAVNFMGYYDGTTSQYIVTQIMVQIY